MKFKWSSIFGKKKKIIVKDIYGSNVKVFDGVTVTSDELEDLLQEEKIVRSQISESKREYYIDRLELDDYLVSRTFVDFETHYDNSTRNRFFDSDNDFQLEEILKKEKAIVLLGNPGLGKTTEMKRLAVNTWESRESDFVPIYKDLRSFTVTDSIDNFISIRWKNLDKVLFIFDGLDEIRDVQDFTSKLVSFFSYLEEKKINFRIVVSCRTNVYEKVVKGIDSFNPVYLKDLTYEEGVDLLNKLCAKEVGYDEIQKIIEFLKNPFQIKILANYIDVHSSLPNNLGELWSNYIEARFEHDDKENLKKANTNIPLLKHLSKKTSIISELMKTNTLSEDQIFRITKNSQNDFNDFKLNPLMDKSSITNEWFFEHRNIQEYFAAIVLSEMDLESTIKFVEIDNMGKTHPSLFNTITFLLNILEESSDKFIGIVDWLMKNEPEILFKTESDRLSNGVRIKVFKDYFTEVSIEKTLWLNTNRTFSDKELATFASCKENYEFLIEIVVDKTNHFRTIYSALKVLMLMKIEQESIPALKDLLIEMLKDEKVNMNIKSVVVDVIKEQELTVDDNDYLKKIIEMFSTESDNRLNNSILHLIVDKVDVEEYFDYILSEFLRANDIVEREEKDNVSRGNKLIIQKMLLRFNKSCNFLEIAKYYFHRDLNLWADEQFSRNLCERVTLFIREEETFLEKFIDEIKGEYSFHRHKNMLLRIFSESESQERAISILLEKLPFREIMGFISRLVTESNLGSTINKIIDNGIKDDEIELFRNNIGNNNSRKLSELFHLEMEKKGVVFKEPVFTELMEKRSIERMQSEDQSMFDLLFNKQRLKDEIKLIFQDAKTVNFNRESLAALSSDWYRKTNLHGLSFLPLNIISDVLRRKNVISVDFSLVEESIDDDFFLIHIIKEKIFNSSGKIYELNISEKQIEFIKSWCHKTIAKIDFNKIILWHKSNSFSYIDREYEKVEDILFFHNKFDIELPVEFLLNCLEFFEFDKNAQLNESFIAFVENIGDENLVNAKIVDNLINKKLFSFSMSKHIEYALLNKLDMAYPAIKNYLTKNDSSYNDKKLLETYIELTKDYNVLEECCTNNSSETTIFWNAISLMMNFKMKRDFCISESKKYLDSGHTTFVSSALEVLFEANDIKAVEFIRDNLRKEYGLILHSVPFSRYSAIKDYNILEELYLLIYYNKEDNLGFHDFVTFFQYYVTNLSSNDEGYKKVNEILSRIYTKLKKEGRDLFYINSIIGYSRDGYLYSKSKPYKFERAILEVEQILN